MADARALRQHMLDTMIVGEARALRDSRRWLAIGLLVLAGTFGAALAWSLQAPLSSAVVASGAVKVDSSRKKVQHPEGGVIKAILVADGSVVQSGDVLVQMDETRAGAAHGVVVGGRDIALATRARLIAERDELSAIRFPESLAARAEEPQVADILRAQRTLFAARRAARDGELNILDQQIGSLRSEIAGFDSQRRAKQEQQASVESDLHGLKELDAVGMVEKTRLRAIERDIAKLRGEQEELVSRIAATRTGISERELKKFQVRKAAQEQVAQELKTVQAEHFELLERESATRRTLELTELRAPVAGTVTGLNIHTTGGVVNAGEVLMEIVPSADKLVVEARVLPSDIDRVALGLRTGIKLHAFNQRTTPELEGRVVYVSADAAQDPRTEQDYFMVRVDVVAEELQRLGSERVQPGMQADIFIRTGERTFFGYLMQPLTESFRKAWLER